MRALRIVVAAMLFVLLIASVALAAPSPAPDLEGRNCHSYTGFGSDPKLIRGPNAGRKGWYISTPFVYVKDEFNDAIRLMGGQLVSSRVFNPGDYVIIWRAIPVYSDGFLAGLTIGWRGSAITIPHTVRVKLTRKIYEVKNRTTNDRLRDEDWILRWTTTQVGSDKCGAIAVRIDDVVRIDDREIGLVYGQYKSFWSAEQKAVLSALSEMLEKPKMTTSRNEPIGVSRIEGDLVIIDAGSLRRVVPDAGSLRGVEPGDAFKVFATGYYDDNSSTGLILDQNTKYIATIEAVTVEDHKSSCRVTWGDIRDIKRNFRCVPAPPTSTEAPRL